MQLREVLDDLRLGRLTMRVTEPAMPAMFDRAGRRVFSGLVVMGALVSGSIMVASGERHETLGIVTLVIGGVLLFAHWMIDVTRGTKKT